MAVISVSLPSDGSTADVSDYNTPITTIVNEINGNLDNANIKTAAAIATSKLADDAGIGSPKLAAGVPVQVVNTASGATASGSTIIPLDDTVPQNTEGVEFMTLAITPKSATNILVIDVEAQLTYSVATHIIGAIFQDSIASALAAGDQYLTTPEGLVHLRARHIMVSGTTSATTFKFRAGGHTAGTIYFNGDSSGRRLGAIPKSSIVITEYKA